MTSTTSTTVTTTTTTTVSTTTTTSTSTTITADSDTIITLDNDDIIILDANTTTFMPNRTLGKKKQFLFQNIYLGYCYGLIYPLPKLGLFYESNYNIHYCLVSLSIMHI